MLAVVLTTHICNACSNLAFLHFIIQTIIIILKTYRIEKHFPKHLSIEFGMPNILGGT